MATSGMLPPPPSADPEPWSEKDFAPIISFLRNQIGITLEPHRMGLLQARLRSRLQVTVDQQSTDTLYGGTGVDWFWTYGQGEARDLNGGEGRN